MMDDNQIIETVAPETTAESVESTGNQDGVSTPDDFLEIKYNKEAIRLDKEKAVELAQKGMNYEKAVERAKQEARDAYIAEQGYEWNGRQITTETEYRQALREQEMIEQYQQKDIPEEVIQELIENKKFRETYETQQRQSQEQIQKEQDYRTFLESYPTVRAEEIPQSVWEDVAKGKTLTDSYIKYENQMLKEKLNRYEKIETIESRNQENAKSSIGAVQSSGTIPIAFTREQVAKMSTQEVNQNWKAIQESMKKW